MVERNAWIKHEAKEITFFVLFGIFVAIILPTFIGLGLLAFQETFIEGRPIQFGDLVFTYMIYYIFIIGALLGLPTMKIREMFITNKGEHPANQSKPKLFAVAYLHDPEQDGALYQLFHWLGMKKNPMRWTQSILRCFVIGTLIFALLGILQVASGIEFAGIPQTQFQVTKFSATYLTAEPPSFGETCLLLLPFSIMMSLVAYLSSKLKAGKGFYFLVGILIICVLMGFGWMQYHNIVYQHSEAKQIATFMFGFLGSLITLLTGTFIFWYTWHFWNNVFVKLGEIIPIKEDIVFIAIIIWAILLILYIFIEVALYLRRKKNREAVQIPT